MAFRNSLLTTQWSQSFVGTNIVSFCGLFCSDLYAFVTAAVRTDHDTKQACQARVTVKAGESSSD